MTRAGRRQAESGRGGLPDFICIGAMKTGTTTLHRLLASHPSIRMPREKELNYFVAERNHPKGEGWYRSHFGGADLSGECSPNYTNWPRFDGVAERMRALVPRARLIYCVRDPVARALSNYKHALASGHETRPVDAVLGDEAYLRRSRYHAQISRFLDAGYKLEDILVVAAEDLLDQRDATMRGVVSFLGAPDRPLPVGADLHASRHKRVPTELGRAVQRRAAPALRRLPWAVRSHAERALLWPVSRPMPPVRPSAATIGRLRAALAEDVAAFRKLVGRDFEGWSF